MDRVLLFAAGGLAITEMTLDDVAPDWGKDQHTHVGWTIGGGIEFALSENLIMRAEYLYDDYGSEDYHIVGLAEYDADIDLTGSTIRGGLAYKFPVP